MTMSAPKSCTANFTTGSQGQRNPGVFRPSAGQWFLDLNGNGWWDGCAVDLPEFGAPGDVPVAGKW